ncbi:hypothetical protein N0V90_003393 [Kalmusia sp. IMI 367209]|nr:hypothetical protein N0V90_003393 [Kalmusia sp. IMI 367209]
MVKTGLLGFGGRRKSQGNIMDEAKPHPTHDAATAGGESPSSSSGGFRLMSTTEAEKRKMEEKRRAQEKAASKFRPFSSFSAGNKQRNRSIDEDSPGSSKRYAYSSPSPTSAADGNRRDSKSSSGTQSSRPYNNGQFGSTSTLPSSADADSNDNIFAIPRPHLTQHGSSPSGLSAHSYKKQLPAPPPSESRFGEPTSPIGGFGRVRAMTSSSYASTAKPPTLDADMNFGSTSFDDLFSGIDRKGSPERVVESPGRSLLAGKRTFHAEPIKIDRKLEVEAPLKSWDSRGSADNLMSSPRSPDDDSPPPPVPPHKYGQYAPVASYSPEMNGTNDYVDNDASVVRKSVMSRKSLRESSPEQEPTSVSSSSAASLETPLSSRSTSDISTPKAALRAAASPISRDEDDNMFSSPTQKQTPLPKPAIPAPKAEPRPQPPANDSGRRVMTQAEFRAQQQRAMVQSQESSDEDDYEDEEEAQERAAQEAIARRKKQQMDLARETMRRTTTAPGNVGRPDGSNEPFSMSFPSETSLQADEWEDEDVPLGILAQHGFPSASRNKAPAQPANAMPSYFPERPASAGAGDNRASQAFRPVFARNLPDDPHASFIGGGLVRPTNRESLGFSRGPASVAGDSVSAMHMPMMGYPEPQLSAPSLVEQIHMRDMTKQKYMGGASSKKPQEGPFTGMLGAQMNPPIQTGPNTRMSMMNGMPGMGMNMNMMGGPMGSPMGMPMMGGQMGYPMQQNDMMQMQQFQQMQQMLAAQQFQIQQMQMQHSQDPRMSMAFPSNMSDPRMSMAFPNNQMPQQQDPRMSMAAPSFLNIPSGQRPMSIMPVSNQQPGQPPRPFSTPMGGTMTPPPPLNGYTPSIAPSERSNIGLSARYRPVQTHNDAKSSSSMTLQASGSQNPAMIKATLKSKSPVAQEDDDDGWGKMAARKSKFAVNGAPKTDEGGSLRDLVRGIDGL